MAKKTSNATLVAALSAAALIQGCSSGGGNVNGGPPAAQAPRISGLSALIVEQDTVVPAQIFRLEDGDTPISQLELSVTTSDSVLLPLRGIVIEGSGAERTLRITPNADGTGTASVMLTARDPGGLTGTATLEVRINPVLVAFSSVANTAFSAADGGAAAKVFGVTVQPDVDEDPRAFDTLLQQGAQ